MTSGQAATFAELVERLRTMSVTSRKTGQTTTQAGMAQVSRGQWSISTSEGELLVDSWKFPEFEYAAHSEKLPCKARGLFTSSDRIVARGYDKFFNINEFEFVSHASLKRDCQGPFQVSTKENGCIMFFAGLADSTLVVCSKNVTGNYDAEPDSMRTKHYRRGIEEINRQLAAIGKSSRDFAAALYEKDVTAVAELCDDAFEEHILEYPPDTAGLYLHGLNKNTIKLESSSPEKITEFAAEWGFKMVDQLTWENYDEMIAYMQDLSQSGVYQGREIEGFVIRCRRNNADYFFKYKFEQPYHLYRQFREATLKLYSDQKKRTVREVVSSFPKFQRITLAYAEFASQYFEDHPEKIDDFKQNIGIIKIRKMFLRHLGFEEKPGVKLLELEQSEKLSEKLERLVQNTRTVYCLVTIAAPGSGKTTTCMTLAGLCPEWVHVQNDDHNKQNNIIVRTLTELDTKPVVMFDRINYRERYRAEFFEKIAATRHQHLRPDVEIKFIGINFMRSGPSPEGYSHLEERVLRRGDNHQSVLAASNPKTAISLLKDVYKSYQSPRIRNHDEAQDLPEVVSGGCLIGADNNFSLVINVDTIEPDSSLENAKIIYRQLTEKYPELKVKDFSEDEWKASFEAAKMYVPKNKKTVSAPSRKVSYYGVHIDRDVVYRGLDEILEGNETWETLKRAARVQNEFHVTLCHSFSLKEAKENKEVWEDLGRLFAKNAYRKKAAPQEKVSVPFFANVRVEQVVVVENQLVALKVSMSTAFKKSDGNFTQLPTPLPTANKYLHITIGTCHASIKPVMSNVYLNDLYRNGEVTSGTHVLTNGQAEVITWSKELQRQEAFIYFA